MIDKAKYQVDATVEPIGVDYNPATDSLDPEKHKLIYVFYYEDSKNHCSKIGEAKIFEDKTAEECAAHRFDNYSSTGQEEKFYCEKLFVVPKVLYGRNYSDKRFHSYLRNNGITKTNDIQHNEFYDIPYDEVELKLRSHITGDTVERFVPHGAKVEDRDSVVEHIKEMISKGEISRVVADLCARYGKTDWFLDVFYHLVEECGFGYWALLMPSHWLSTHNSMASCIEQYDQWYKRFHFIDTVEMSQEAWIKEIQYCLDNEELIPVIGISLCGDEEAEKYAPLAEIPSDRKMVIIDEADFGSHTEKSQAIIEAIS